MTFQWRTRRFFPPALLAALCAGALLVPGAQAAIPVAPGGPVLVVTSTDGFGGYLPEILRTEGLNEFSTATSAQLSAQALAGKSVVILGPGALSSDQVATLTAWVRDDGGQLIAMRPDPKLAPLLGLSGPGGTLTDAYMKVDTSQAPGKGIASSSMQFHGTADLYGLAGARAVASLYSTASTATASPAVTLNSVGDQGGQAAAFAYDLGRSVVYTRQGNPAWSGQERDNADDPTAGGGQSIRPDDLFFGAAPGDLQPDWVNLDKVQIPQADEQQRLLANLVTQMSTERMPLPRFWYFPRGLKGAVVMTGDDHQPSQFDTVRRLNDFYDTSVARNPDCATGAAGHAQAVSEWRCILATVYMYPPGLTDGYTTDASMSASDAQAFVSAGFELSLHLRVSPSSSQQCVNYGSTTELKGDLDTQLAEFAGNPHWAGIIPAPTTIRTHCVIWADYSSQPAVDQSDGVRLNTDYYYWPRSWTQGRAGMFTGSGIPMRFADANGGIFDVFQAPTQIPDETYLVGSTLTVDVAGVTSAINTLLDNATGSNGYYGAFVVNMHNDGEPTDQQAADNIIQSAVDHGVPVISARQLLQWLDARGASAFRNMTFDATGRMTFTIDPSSSATGLQAMLPIKGGGGSNISLTRDGTAVATTTKTIKGVDYLVFDATAGDYVATYPAPPVHPHHTPAPGGGGGTGGGGGGTTPPGSGVKPVQTASLFPHLTASAKTFRVGGRRVFTLTFKMPRKAAVTWTIRNAKGKVIRRIKTKTYAKGAIVTLKWNGRDGGGHYVKAGRYSYTVKISAGHYSRSVGGSVRVTH
jgi:hypothetical protein